MFIEFNAHVDRCPFCGGFRIESEGGDHSCEAYVEQIVCNECHKKWQITFVYKFHSIESLMTTTRAADILSNLADEYEENREYFDDYGTGERVETIAALRHAAQMLS